MVGHGHPLSKSSLLDGTLEEDPDFPTAPSGTDARRKVWPLLIHYNLCGTEHTKGCSRDTGDILTKDIAKACVCIPDHSL